MSESETFKYIIEKLGIFSEGQIINKDKIHQGVYCNLCYTTIKDIRHHCPSCDDYDLCNQCLKEVGHQHELNQIDSPEKIKGYDNEVIAVKYLSKEKFIYILKEEREISEDMWIFIIILKHIIKVK